jgi:hypothetical protein
MERLEGLRALPLSPDAAQIPLISGLESRRSLEVYRHLSLDAVAEANQEVMKPVGV